MEPTPTPEELDRHRRAIIKLRNHIFKEYALGHSAIVPASEVILPIKIMERRYETGRDPVREVLLGGLQYDIKSPQPGKSYRLVIEHWSRDSFSVWLSYDWPGHRPESQSRFSNTFPFREVPKAVRDMIMIARYEDFESLLKQDNDATTVC